MEIISQELTVEWYLGAQIGYVDNVIVQESDSGVVEPVNRQSRPLMQATFATWDVAGIVEMFGSTRSGRRGFFIRPPVEAFKKVSDAGLGIATGAAQSFQLQIIIGTLAWDAKYPVESTIQVFKDGTLIPDSAWALGTDGEIELAAGAAANGQVIRATFEYLTAVRFVDAELMQQIETADFTTIQSVTVREVF